MTVVGNDEHSEDMTTRVVDSVSMARAEESREGYTRSTIFPFPNPKTHWHNIVGWCALIVTEPVIVMYCPGLLPQTSVVEPLENVPKFNPGISTLSWQVTSQLLTCYIKTSDCEIGILPSVGMRIGSEGESGSSRLP